MKISYVRVSLLMAQKLCLQKRALNQAGCERIFTDQGVSGSTVKR